MLLLRGIRAASTAAAGTGAARSVSVRLTSVAALSSSPSPGGRRRKGQRRGESKPPAPAQPQPLSPHGGAPRKKKASARPAEDKKTRAGEEARGPPRLEGQARKEMQLPQEKPKRVVRWKCASGCGACCKLDKGPDFPTPDEIFADHPDHLEVTLSCRHLQDFHCCNIRSVSFDQRCQMLFVDTQTIIQLRVNRHAHDESLVQVYKSMIGDDGWCTNYDKSTRTCNIYQGNLPTHNSKKFFSSTSVWLYDITF
jgi:uncharacterized protein